MGYRNSGLRHSTDSRLYWFHSEGIPHYGELSDGLNVYW